MVFEPASTRLHKKPVAVPVTLTQAETVKLPDRFSTNEDPPGVKIRPAGVAVSAAPAILPPVELTAAPPDAPAL